MLIDSSSLEAGDATLSSYFEMLDFGDNKRLLCLTELAISILFLFFSDILISQLKLHLMPSLLFMVEKSQFTVQDSHIAKLV